jgi:hypothetical protein
VSHVQISELLWNNLQLEDLGHFDSMAFAGFYLV